MKIRVPSGIARWSRLAVPLAALLFAGCSSVSEGIRILLVNGTQTQLTAFVESNDDQAEVNLNQGNQNLILEGDANEQVTVAFRDQGQLVATITCTATARIVGPDDPGVEYGEIFIQDFNGGTPVANCVSGWVESDF